MLTDNNEIFRNCYVVIYCHLPKVSSQINKCIIFEPNEHSITLLYLLYGLTNILTNISLSAHNVSETKKTKNMRNAHQISRMFAIYLKTSLNYL